MQYPLFQNSWFNLVTNLETSAITYIIDFLEKTDYYCHIYAKGQNARIIIVTFYSNSYRLGFSL